jgi:hypothetical protein
VWVKQSSWAWVAGVQHGDTGCKVDETATFHIPQLGVQGTGGVHRRADAHTTRRSGGAARIQGCVAGGGGWAEMLGIGSGVHRVLEDGGW